MAFFTQQEHAESLSSLGHALFVLLPVASSPQFIKDSQGHLIFINKHWIHIGLDFNDINYRQSHRGLFVKYTDSIVSLTFAPKKNYLVKLVLFFAQMLIWIELYGVRQIPTKQTHSLMGTLMQEREHNDVLISYTVSINQSINLCFSVTRGKLPQLLHHIHRKDWSVFYSEILAWPLYFITHSS